MDYLPVLLPERFHRQDVASRRLFSLARSYNKQVQQDWLLPSLRRCQNRPVEEARNGPLVLRAQLVDRNSDL